MRYFLIALFALSFACAEDAKLPYEAQQAVNAMEAQIIKARQDCLNKLSKVIGDVTKTGNLELAMVVKAKETEIMNLMPRVDLFGDSNKAAIVGKWTNGTWSHTYMSDGTAINSSVGAGKWVIVGNKMTVTWTSNNWVDTLNLPVKNNTLSGYNKGGSFTITKLPNK